MPAFAKPLQPQRTHSAPILHAPNSNFSSLPSGESHSSLLQSSLPACSPLLTTAVTPTTAVHSCLLHPYATAVLGQHQQRAVSPHEASVRATATFAGSQTPHRYDSAVSSEKPPPNHTPSVQQAGHLVEPQGDRRSPAPTRVCRSSCSPPGSSVAFVHNAASAATLHERSASVSAAPGLQPQQSTCPTSTIEVVPTAAHEAVSKSPTTIAKRRKSAYEEALSSCQDSILAAARQQRRMHEIQRREARRRRHQLFEVYSATTRQRPTATGDAQPQQCSPEADRGGHAFVESEPSDSAEQSAVSTSRKPLTSHPGACRGSVCTAHTGPQRQHGKSACKRKQPSGSTSPPAAPPAKPSACCTKVPSSATATTTAFLTEEEVHIPTYPALAESKTLLRQIEDGLPLFRRYLTPPRGLRRYVITGDPLGEDKTVESTAQLRTTADARLPLCFVHPSLVRDDSMKCPSRGGNPVVVSPEDALLTEPPHHTDSPVPSSRTAVEVRPPWALSRSQFCVAPRPFYNWRFGEESVPIGDFVQSDYSFQVAIAEAKERLARRERAGRQTCRPFVSYPVAPASRAVSPITRQKSSSTVCRSTSPTTPASSTGETEESVEERFAKFCADARAAAPRPLPRDTFNVNRILLRASLRAGL